MFTNKVSWWGNLTAVEYHHWSLVIQSQLCFYLWSSISFLLLFWFFLTNFTIYYGVVAGYCWFIESWKSIQHMEGLSIRTRILISWQIAMGPLGGCAAYSQNFRVCAVRGHKLVKVKNVKNWIFCKKATPRARNAASSFMQ